MTVPIVSLTDEPMPPLTAVQAAMRAEARRPGLPYDRPDLDDLGQEKRLDDDGEGS